MNRKGTWQTKSKCCSKWPRRVQTFLEAKTPGSRPPAACSHARNKKKKNGDKVMDPSERARARVRQCLGQELKFGPPLLTFVHILPFIFKVMTRDLLFPLPAHPHPPRSNLVPASRRGLAIGRAKAWRRRAKPGRVKRRGAGTGFFGARRAR